jgi:hypothetical protein
MRIKTQNLIVLAFVAGLVGCSDKDDSKKAASGTTAPAATNNSQGGTVAQAVMATPRGEHTATRTSAGVLVTGGEAANVVLATAELYQNGAWRAAGAMTMPRKGHTATVLSNGEVLVAGGQRDVNGKVILGTTEIYSPVTNVWRAGPQMFTPRSGHVAAAFRTANGDFVLFAGGSSSSGALRTAELYDVTNARFVPVAAPMVSDRVGAEAVALTNGKILIQGGIAALAPGAVSTTPAPAELFDTAAQTFVAATSMGIDRFGNALTLLDNNTVLALGGQSPARTEDTGEVYDPATNSWSNFAAPLSSPRTALSVTSLGGGKLLAAGGTAGAPSATIELIDALNPQTTVLRSLNEARSEHTATKLANGNVLIVGGFGVAGALSSSEEYDVNATSSVSPGQPGSPFGPAPIGGVNPGNPGQPAQPTQAPANMLAILPGKGKPGDLITIAGSGFAKDKSANQVIFQGGVFGKVLYNLQVKRLPLLGSVETLLVEVPTGAQSGDVSVISNGVPARNTKGFTIDLASGKPPSVLYTLPRRQDVGGIVTIFGRNFARPASDNIVRFSGVQANLIGGITTQSIPFLGNVAVMLVRVPSGAVTGDLTIEAHGKVSNGYAFEVKGTTAGSGSTGSTTGSTGSTTGSTGSTTGSTGSTGNTNQVFFSEDFEGQTVRFNEQGGLWQASQPAMGPGRAASGSWCAGTAMTTGQYAAGARGYLLSREIDLSQATVAELSFNQWVDTDGMDAGRILVTNDGGATYYLVRPNGGYQATGIFNPGEGITGANGGWTGATVDLSAFAGDRITVVFDFKADGSDQRSGWYVDDVQVSGR